jgi:hypothetical protein
MCYEGLQTFLGLPTAFQYKGYNLLQGLPLVTRVTDLSMATDIFPKSGLLGLQAIRAIPTASRGYDWLQMVTRVINYSFTTECLLKSRFQGLQTTLTTDCLELKMK